MKLSSALANLAWLAVNAPGARRFRAALAGVEREQEAILRGYVHANRDTEFGRSHRFDEIASVRDFQARVPLRNYDDHQPFIGRIAAGDQRVLTHEPVELFEPSSGSTRSAKWIPYTRGLRREFRRGIAPWIVDLFGRKRELVGGPAYWSISPAIARSDDAPSVVPVGFDDDSAYLGGIGRRMVAAVLAVPSDVRRLTDVDDLRRVTLVHLLRCRELRLISVWHPTFLRLLLAPLRERWDQLVDDVARGLSRPAVGIHVRADARRARELRGLRPDDLAAIWPRLGLISCWGDAHARLHVRELEELFPHVELQPKGLIATEAFVTLPYLGRHPLAVRSHFFEFLDDGGAVRLGHELEPGGSYSVVVTTAGGLYRYRLGDRVEVTGFFAKTPCLRFAGRDDHVSDLRGEKLSEGFVSGVLARVFSELSCAPRFAMLAPETASGADRYALYLEADDPVPADLATRLDEALRENPHYDYCLRLRQLAPVRVAPVRRDAYARYVGRLSRLGQTLGDVKPASISTVAGWEEVFAKP